MLVACVRHAPGLVEEFFLLGNIIIVGFISLIDKVFYRRIKGLSFDSSNTKDQLVYWSDDKIENSYQSGRHKLKFSKKK